MRKAATAKTAKIYHLDTKNRNDSSIENRLYSLRDRAADGEIHGMTYIISDKNGEVEVGCVGLHRQNTDIALGTMLRAAVALVMAP